MHSIICRSSILKPIIGLVFVGIFVQSTNSADQPLGIVTSVKDHRIKVEFDPGVHLQPGHMVAIYGSSLIKKHPLTNEVVVEELEQVAKAQIIGKGGNRLETKLTWKKAGIELRTGMDVVPLPKEFAPNSPPIQTGEISDIIAPIQSSVWLRFPIMDPDGDEIFYTWKLTGPAGKTGFLESEITRLPENTWFAPGLESSAKITVIARDNYGQELEVAVNMHATSWDNDWRTRTLRPFCTLGDKASANSLFLTRDDQGRWWSVTHEAVFSISPGWLEKQQFLTATGRSIANPVAIAPGHGENHFLDVDSAVISVYNYSGELNRFYGINSSPTDIAISRQGVVFVADQGLGGVQVYEPDGMFRASLGRAGEGNEFFSGLKRITLDGEEQLYALDTNTHVVHRFSRFHKRLPSWILNLDHSVAVVDIAWHPQNELLVLLSDGQVMRLDKDGKIVKPNINSIAGFAYYGQMASPESIYVDLSGEIFVTYPEEGVITRYTRDYNFYGIRGAPFWALNTFTVDCNGQIYGRFVDSSSIFALDSEGWIIKEIGADNREKFSGKNPTKLAVSPDGQILAVLDSSHDTITRIDLTSIRAPVVFGQTGKHEGQFVAPIDLAIDESGHIYVLDSRLKRVSIFDPNGYFLFSFGAKGNLIKEWRKPILLAVNPNGKTAYICDDHELKKYTIDHKNKTAKHVSNAGGRGKGLGQLLRPEAMASDRQGLLYLVDNGRRDLQVFDFRGNNAIVIYTTDLEKWTFEKVSEMILNVDGRPYLFDSGRLVGFNWGK